MHTFYTQLKVGPVSKKATTQRKRFPFTAMCKFAGEYVGVCSEGLFHLEGNTDNGVNIDASFTLGTMDYGTFLDKREQDMWISLQSWGKLLITVTFDDNLVTGPFSINPRFTDGKRHRTYVKLSEGAKGTVLTHKIENYKGCDFSIDKIEAMVTVSQVSE